MSRCTPYESDDYTEERRQYGIWKSNLARQIYSQRGQTFLRELLAALEALPQKVLIAGAIAKRGAVCPFGALAVSRSTADGQDRELVLADLSKIVVDPDLPGWEGQDMDEWAQTVLDAPNMLAWQIPFENDSHLEQNLDEEGHCIGLRAPSDEERYAHVIKWIRNRIV